MVADLEPIPARLGRHVTEEEYYALGEDEPYELLDGRLVLSRSWSYRHASLFGLLLTLLSSFLDDRHDAEMVGPRFAMRLDERWSPEPDLLLVRGEHRDRICERWLEGPADWTIEILSSRRLRIESRYKLPRYRAAGVPEIWLVDPFEKTLRVELREVDGTYSAAAHAAGRVESRTLPGFWIDAGWLAADPLPSRGACLREILGEE